VKASIHSLVVYLHCHIRMLSITSADNICRISPYFTTLKIHPQISISTFYRRPIWRLNSMSCITMSLCSEVCMESVKGSNRIQTCSLRSPYKPCTNGTSHAPSENSTVSINVLTAATHANDTVCYHMTSFIIYCVQATRIVLLNYDDTDFHQCMLLMPVCDDLHSGNSTWQAELGFTA